MLGLFLEPQYLFPSLQVRRLKNSKVRLAQCLKNVSEKDAVSLQQLVDKVTLVPATSSVLAKDMETDEAACKNVSMHSRELKMRASNESACSITSTGSVNFMKVLVARSTSAKEEHATTIDYKSDLEEEPIEEEKEFEEDPEVSDSLENEAYKLAVVPASAVLRKRPAAADHEASNVAKKPAAEAKECKVDKKPATAHGLCTEKPQKLMSAAFGELCMTYATDQSYIRFRNDDGKLVLLVAVSKKFYKDHAHLCGHLAQWVAKQGKQLKKEDVVAFRDSYK